MKSYFLMLVVLGVSSTLIGCSSARNYGKVDYSKIESGQELRMPPDLATMQKAIDARLQKEENPGGNQTDSKKTLAAKEADRVYIERSGNQRWLVVEESAEVVWPRLKAFWLELNIPIAIEIPDIGLLETDWSERRVKTPAGTADTAPKSLGTRDKFRVRLERVAPGVSEIYITERGLVEQINPDGKTTWVSRDDPQTEAEYLSRLLQWFKKDKTDKAEAKPIVAVANARFVKGGSSGVTTDNAENVEVDTLILSEDIDLGWRRLGLALDRASFVVSESSRDKGSYQILYLDPVIEATLGKKTGKDKDGKALVADHVFFLQIKSVQKQTYIVVLNQEGKPEKSPYSEKILKVLLEQLR